MARLAGNEVVNQTYRLTDGSDVVHIALPKAATAFATKCGFTEVTSLPDNARFLTDREAVKLGYISRIAGAYTVQGQTGSRRWKYFITTNNVSGIASLRDDIIVGTSRCKTAKVPERTTLRRP